MLTRKITIYRNATDNVGREGTFEDFLKECFANSATIEKLRATDDDNEKRALKKTLPCATLSGVFAPTRSTANLIEHSGLLCIDIDHCDTDKVMEQLDHLNTICYLSRSASGQGVFAVFLLAYPDRHEEQFNSIADYLSRNYGIVADTQCKDVTRLRFVSYDADARINLNALPYKGIKSKQVPKYQPHQYHALQGDTINNPEYTAKWIDKYVRGIEAQRIDITDNYDDWLKVGAALASQGECYRSYYHRVSALSPKYNPNETDAKFTQCLSMERIGIGTFFSLCKDYGVQPL